MKPKPKAKPKPKLSLAIATYNEEKNITRSLKSVHAWVNEIILVDGQSSDNTVKLAKKFPKVKVISTTNKPITVSKIRLAPNAVWLAATSSDRGPRWPVKIPMSEATMQALQIP